MRKLIVVMLLLAWTGAAYAAKCENTKGECARGYTSSGVDTVFDLGAQPLQQDGTNSYCRHCGIGPNGECVDAGAGGGAEASRINGIWYCGCSINATGNVPDPLNINHIHGINVLPEIDTMIWNEVIDPRVLGCHADMKTATDIVTTDGSPTITSASAAWTAADVGKLIRIERQSGSSANYTVYNGTIAAFNSASSVNLDANYINYNALDVGANRAEWATADDTCLGANLRGAIGDTTALRNIQMQISIPIAISTTWLLRNLTGWVRGGGIAQRASASGQAMSPGIYWFGPPDIPEIELLNSYGVDIEDLLVVGNTISAPSWGIQIVDDATFSRLSPSTMNTFRNVGLGGFFSVGGIDSGNGVGTRTPAGDHAVGDKSFDVGTAPAAPNHLGPNSPVYILDNTGGREVGYTAPTYVRDTNPIILSDGATYAHLAVNTKLYYSIGSLVHGIGTDVTVASGAGNEKHLFDHVEVRNAAACLTVGSGNAANGEAIGLSCNSDFIGFNIPNGGQMTANAAELIGVCLRANLGGTGASLDIIQDSIQLGAGDSCGTSSVVGFAGAIAGMSMELVTTSGQQARPAGAGPSFITYKCTNCNLNIGRQSAPDGSAYDLAPTNNKRIFQLDRVTLIANQAANSLTPPDAPTVEKINVVPSGGSVTINGTWSSLGAPYRLAIQDPGGANTGFLRKYEFNRHGTVTGELPETTRRELKGATALTDLPNELDWSGFWSHTGIGQVNKFPAAAMPTLTVTGTNDGVEDCWYYAAFSTNSVLQTVSPIAHIQCNTTLDATHYVAVRVVPPFGPDQMHVYGNQGVHGAGDPGSETELNLSPVRINNNYDTSNFPTIIRDMGGAHGGAFPTVDQTGTWTVANKSTALTSGYSTIFSAAGTAIPACSSFYKNQTAYVSDETTACTAGGSYASGGANCCRLFCNNAGTAWKVDGVKCY